MFLAVFGICIFLLLVNIIVALLLFRKNRHSDDISYYEVISVEKNRDYSLYIIDFMGRMVLPLSIVTVESHIVCAILVFIFICYCLYYLRVNVNFVYALLFNVYIVKTDCGITYTVYSFNTLNSIRSGNYREIDDGVLLHCE